MAYEERVQILSEAEQDEFFGPPVFTTNDQRFFFALNDREMAAALRFRNRGQRYMFVVLLGYFKAKPILLSPGFHRVKQDCARQLQNVRLWQFENARLSFLPEASAQLLS